MTMVAVKPKGRIVDAALARSIASAFWGDGARCVPTNRKGIYFCETPGHGGFVAGASALTPEEARRLYHINAVLVASGHQPIYYADAAFAAVDAATGRIVARRHLLGTRPPRAVRRRRDQVLEWVADDVIVAEEDVAWALLALVTGVRATDARSTLRDAWRTVQRWYPEVVAAGLVEEPPREE